MAPARRRLAAVLLLAALPWTVVLIGTEYTGVFLWGLFNTNPPQPVSLYDYLFAFTGGFESLPRWLQAWPTTSVLWLCAVASAGSGALFGREDPRVTAALLGFAAVTNVQLATGFLDRASQTALPLGSAFVLVIVWWYYVPLLRGGSEGGEGR